MSTIKAVIFDMDGVLIEAKEWHYEALNRALALFGYEISRYDHLVTYDGLPTSKKLEMLSMEKGMPRRIHKFINELKQRYRIAVASNSIRHTIELMMEKSNLMEYLDFFLSNQDVHKPKPDPEIYTTAIQRLNLSPEECLVVEDNHNGIQAAKAAGAHVMEVGTVYDVNYVNIKKHIAMAENGRI